MREFSAEDIGRFDEYLDGIMPAEQRQQFENALQLDSELKEALAEHNSLREAINRSARKSMKLEFGSVMADIGASELTNYTPTNGGSGFWSAIKTFLVLTTLAVGLTYAYQSFKTDSVPDYDIKYRIENTTKKQEVGPKSSTPQQDIIIEEVVDTIVTEQVVIQTTYVTGSSEEIDALIQEEMDKIKSENPDAQIIIDYDDEYAPE